MNHDDFKIMLDKAPSTNTFLLIREDGDGTVGRVKQAAKELSIKLYDIRLGQCVRGDLYGLPTFEYGDRFPPWWWSTDHKSRGVILFDEIETLMSRDLDLATSVLFDIGINRDLHPGLSNGHRIIITVSLEMISGLDPAMVNKFIILSLT
jgi:hypothetical protein